MLTRKLFVIQDKGNKLLTEKAYEHMGDLWKIPIQYTVKSPK